MGIDPAAIYTFAGTYSNDCMSRIARYIHFMIRQNFSLMSNRHRCLGSVVKSSADDLQSQSKKEWAEDTTKTDKEWRKSDQETVDQVADVGEESWELDAEQRLKSDVNLTKGEGDEDRLEGWVQLGEEGVEEPGEDNWLSIELTKDIIWQVAQVLAGLDGGLLGRLELGVDSLESRCDSGNVVHDGSSGSLLVSLAGIGWESSGDRV